MWLSACKGHNSSGGKPLPNVNFPKAEEGERFSEFWFQVIMYSERVCAGWESLVGQRVCCARPRI